MPNHLVEEIVTIRVFTHVVDPDAEFDPESDDSPSLRHREYAIECREDDARRIVECFYGGEGSTSVHEDTVARFPQPDGPVVECPTCGGRSVEKS